jgi:L-lactate dehydrogenase
MDFFIPIISIIGFGETGSIIGSLVNCANSNIKINIIDPNEQLEGRIIDLRDAAAANNNKIIWNNTELLEKSQLIFFTAGVRNQPGESRSKKNRDNQSIIKTVFKGLVLKESSLIVSISNPVEATAQLIHQTIKGKCTVLSTGTLLDTFRLKTILSQHFKASKASIETIVIGEHGSEMFPLWSQTKIKEKSILSLVDTDQLTDFTNQLKGVASKIRETQPATKFGVAQAAIKLADQYFSNQTKLIPIAFSAKELESENIFVNWPCYLGKQHIIPLILKLTPEEKKQWASALQSIRKTTSDITSI